MASGDGKPKRLASRMLLTAWLAQNAASGFAFGSFGPMIAVYEDELGVDRSLSSAGLPLMLLTMALLAPLVGRATLRFTLRQMMSVGALLMTCGFVTLAFADSIEMVLAAYALLVGPGYSLLGAMLPSTLASRWFGDRVGRALGIVNMPLFLGLVPLGVAAVFSEVGRQGVFVGIAIAIFCLLPFTMSIIDHPVEQVSDVDAKPDQPPTTALTIGEILRRRDFWWLCFSASILAGAGVSIATHIVPMAIGWGEPATSAALLLSINGFAGIIGSALFGRLADRIGGIGAMGAACVGAALFWLTLLGSPPFTLLLPISFCLGAIGAALVATVAAAINQRFGTINFSQVFGLFSLVNLPLVVGAPIFAGIVFTAFGSYALAIIVEVMLLVSGALVAYRLSRKWASSAVLQS